MDAIPAWVVPALRAAGCVFAEDEARLLREAARGPGAGGDLRTLVARRAAGELLEHLVGWVDFGGLRLSVGPGVFVPRQRTLLLADVAAQLLDRRGPGHAVEAFCGVAPLAATLAARHPAWEVHACDVSRAAIVHAARNLAPARVHVGPGLAGLPRRLRGRVDVLVAVTPYVPEAEAALLPRDILAREPRGALVSGADGLDAFRGLLAEARAWLAPGGRVAVELHVGQVTPAVAAAADAGYRASATHEDDGTAVLVVERRP